MDEVERPVAEQPRRGRRRGVVAAQHGANAGQKFARVAGLGDIIVGAEFQPDDLVDIGADGKTLRPGTGIAIPAGETVRFAPPGPYVQLIEVNRVARGLDEIELSFTFSDNNVLYATAPFTTPEGATRP